MKNTDRLSYFMRNNNHNRMRSFYNNNNEVINDNNKLQIKENLKFKNSVKQFETLENPFLFDLDTKNSENSTINDELDENNNSNNNNNIDNDNSNNDVIEMATFSSTMGPQFATWGMVALMTSESFSMEVIYEKSSDSVDGANTENSENTDLVNDNNYVIDNNNNKNKTLLINNKYNNNNNNNDKKINNKKGKNDNNDNTGQNRRKMTEYYNNLYTTKSGNKNKKEAYGSCVAFAGNTILIAAELGTGKLNYTGVVYIDENILEYLSYTDLDFLNIGEKIPSFGSNKIISRITGFSNSALGLGLIIIIPTLALAALAFYKSTPANQKDIFSGNITPLKKLFTMNSDNYDDDNIDFEIENNNDNHVTFNNDNGNNNEKSSFIQFLSNHFRSNNNNINNNKNRNNNRNKNKNNNDNNNEDVSDDDLEFENEILNDLESDPSSLENLKNNNNDENNYLMPVQYSLQNFLKLTRGYIKSKQNDYDDNNNNDNSNKDKVIEKVIEIEKIEYENSEERNERRGEGRGESREKSERKKESKLISSRDRSGKQSDMKNIPRRDAENVPYLMTIEKSVKVRRESRSRRSRNKEEKEEREDREDREGREEEKESREEGKEEEKEDDKEEGNDNNRPLLMRI